MRRSARSGAQGRSNRDLALLKSTGSTARVFNLIDIARRQGDDPDYAAAPVFRHPSLNRSIIVKHRLRANERDLFDDGRTASTKVILPIDVTDLRSGARTFFVGQIGYEDVLKELFGATAAQNSDSVMLALLDRLPSLDPFLMRERLRKAGFHPGRCYFDLSDADIERMFAFVKREISPLIGMSFGDIDVGHGEKTTRFAQKILANAADAEFEPFRIGMGMDRVAFDEGLFCWKGFLYYKWTLNDLLPKVKPLSAEIAGVMAQGPVADHERHYILEARARLSRNIALSCETVRETLRVYDDAFRDLTRNGQPKAFREFLLRAPDLFYDLGERLAAVQHITSFWRYRFPEATKRVVQADELVDLLADFEFSLNCGGSLELV